MGPRHRPAPAAILAGGFLLVAAGCNADATAETPLDRATGAVLADGADRLADALEADDGCRALLEADALRERAARALEGGEAPEDVVEETNRVVAATTIAITCEQEADTDEDVPEQDGADETAEPDETDESDETDETDETGESGDDGTTQEASPSPSPDDGAEREEPDEGEGGGPNGPARGQGPDGDGPPGHRDGRGGG